jgi:hypothetical protein
MSISVDWDYMVKVPNIAQYVVMTGLNGFKQPVAGFVPDNAEFSDLHRNHPLVPIDSEVCGIRFRFE